MVQEEFDKSGQEGEADKDTVKIGDDIITQFDQESLRDQDKLEKYAALYGVEEDQIALGPDGFELGKTKVYLGDELYENFNPKLGPNTDKETIEQLSEVIGLSVDLTDIRQEFKDKLTEWEGSIFDDSEEVSYQDLERVTGSLEVGSCTVTLKLNSLETISDLFSFFAKTVEVDNLQQVDNNLILRSAETLKLFNLRSVGGGLYLNPKKEAEIGLPDGIENIVRGRITYSKQ